MRQKGLSIVELYFSTHKYIFENIVSVICEYLSVCSVQIQQIIQLHDSNKISVIGFDSSSHFHVYTINALSGDVLKHESATFSGSFSEDFALVSSDTLVSLDATSSVLVTILFNDGGIKFQQTDISTLTGDSSGVGTIIPVTLNGAFAFKTNTQMLFIRVSGEGKLEVIEKFDRATVFSDALLFTEDKQALGLVQHEGNKIQLTVKLGDDWNNDLIKETIEMDPQRGLVHRVFLNNYIRTDRTHGFRALIVMEDHSLLLLQQGKIVWNREDSLASIIDVTTSELPVEKDGVSVAKVEHNLFEWLKVCFCSISIIKLK